MERIIEFNPAYDKRNSDPKKNYGIHGVNMRMIVKGDKGAVQFVLFTNWMLSHIYEEWERKADLSIYELFCKPLPADVGYHSPIPMYEGQEPIPNCEYLNGKPCYYDGSGIHAEKVFNILVTQGGEAVWKYLEGYYEEMFGSQCSYY